MKCGLGLGLVQWREKMMTNMHTYRYRDRQTQIINLRSKAEVNVIAKVPVMALMMMMIADKERGIPHSAESRATLTWLLR